MTGTEWILEEANGEESGGGGDFDNLFPTVVKPKNNTADDDKSIGKSIQSQNFHFPSRAALWF